MMFAIFVLMLATLVVSFAFLSFFMFATTFMVFAATFVFALMFAFTFVLAFFAATWLWHVGFHLFHFLCHVDSFCSLFLIEVFPVGKSLHHNVNLSHHFRAWCLMMIAFMMFVALLFLIFAAFFLFTIFFVFLFVAA